MGFAIPTLLELVQRARASFRANLKGSDAWLWPNNVGPAAKLIGGMTHEVFGFADYVAQQHFAASADRENLIRHGYEFGLSIRPATPATGSITITAADGAVSVAGGAVFQRGDGALFSATEATGIALPGSLSVKVAATLDGRAGLTVSGTPMSIVSGVTGVGAGTALAEVADDGLVGGSDVEDTEVFRARVLFRKRYTPQGGSAADYVMWASQVSGVTRVFVERLFVGPGSVRIFVLMDGLYADGIPTAGDVARVQAHIDELKPAAALALVAAPTALPINVTISGLEPFRADVQQAVYAELQDAMLRLGRVTGTDSGVLPFLAIPYSFSRSWLWQAVANASGEERHAISAPAGDVALAVGQIPVLGTVSYI